jgi:hypothetical protein
MIKFEGVREALHLSYPHPELISIIKLAAIWSARSGFDVRISSLNDHRHTRPTEANPTAPLSLHYSDLAADFMVQHRNGQPNHHAMEELATFFRDHLGPGHDVLYGAAVKHPNHIHVEADYAIKQRPRRNGGTNGAN